MTPFFAFDATDGQRHHETSPFRIYAEQACSKRRDRNWESGQHKTDAMNAVWKVLLVALTCGIGCYGSACQSCLYLYRNMAQSRVCSSQFAGQGSKSKVKQPHVLFVSLPWRAHFNPLRAIARNLLSRGFAISFAVPEVSSPVATFSTLSR